MPMILPLIGRPIFLRPSLDASSKSIESLGYEGTTVAKRKDSESSRSLSETNVPFVLSRNDARSSGTRNLAEK